MKAAAQGMMDGFKPRQEFQVNGRTVSCPHCRGVKFVRHWGGRTDASGLACEDCGLLSLWTSNPQPKDGSTDQGDQPPAPPPATR